MDIETIFEIENKAKDVLIDAYEGQEILPPIDINKVAKKYGVTIKEGLFKDASVSGMYRKAEKTIYVSGNDSYARKVFTIAHELGHFLLHENKDLETFYRQDALKIGSRKMPEESEADCFAASLLMPRDLIMKFWNVIKDIDVMADSFQVSRTAMYWRLNNLGLIN